MLRRGRRRFSRQKIFLKPSFGLFYGSKASRSFEIISLDFRRIRCPRNFSRIYHICSYRYLQDYKEKRRKRLRTKLMKTLMGVERKKMTKMRTKRPYCSRKNTVRSRSGTSASRSFEPSRGGTGRRLKQA